MRILFADDSMTAQNMGKKILTEAGYEVVAVSNGAAAVKKIAEHKPDIIILDVYMPGYSGLEVCEKVRASVETIKTPVLLTVGKLEPYRAEDANRVRADGVIIKPFEASDLLAIVKKLEERVVPKTVVMSERTIRLDGPPDFSQYAPAAGPQEARTEPPTPAERTTHSTVDVPDHMATSAAFSDLLGSEPSHIMEPLPATPAPSPVEWPVAQARPVEPAAQEFAPPAPEWGHGPEISEPVAAANVEAPVAEAAPAVAIEAEAVSEPVVPLRDTQPIPPYVESEEGAAVAEAAAAVPVETVAAVEPAPIYELEPADEPETAVAASDNHHHAAAPEAPAFVDPELIVTPEPVSSFTAAAAAPAMEPVEAMQAAIETPATYVEPVVEKPAAPEDDFEARVAAAMSVYEEPTAEAAPVEAEPEPVAVITSMDAEPVLVVPEPEPVASFEYSPPVVSEPAAFEQHPVEFAPAAEVAPPLVEVAPDAAVIFEPEVAPAPAMAMEPEAAAPMIEAVIHRFEPLAREVIHEPPLQVEPELEQQVAASIEAEEPAAVAQVAAETGVSTQVISDVVHRVMERLKPELVEEIVRELRNKK